MELWKVDNYVGTVRYVIRKSNRYSYIVIYCIIKRIFILFLVRPESWEN